MGLPGNQWYASWRHHTYAAARVWEAFERVFGQGSDRLVRVIAGQVGWGGGDVCKTQIEALDYATINPNGIKADAWAGAPYMGGNSVNELSGDIAGCIDMINTNKQWLRDNMDYISYEAGQHCISGADAVNRHPGMYQCYSNYLAAMATVTDGVMCHYAHCGAFVNGQWLSGGEELFLLNESWLPGAAGYARRALSAGVFVRDWAD